MILVLSMLEYQSFEQGRDPRRCRNPHQFRSFFMRMKRSHPLHLHALTSNVLSIQQLKDLPEDIDCCKVTALATLSSVGRRVEAYRLPTITYFWIKQTANRAHLISSCLKLHCCAYGLSSKLQIQTITALTNLNAFQTMENGTLWCTNRRSWFWVKKRLQDHKNAPITQCPMEVKHVLQMPMDLAGNLFAIRPTRCNRCKIWFSDHETLSEHRCFRTSNLGPFPCGSRQRIQLTVDFDLSLEPFEILVCECCMMFFCEPSCLQTHQQVCDRRPLPGAMKGWRSSYGCIQPWLTLDPADGKGSLLLTGTPFRKLRIGCEDCLRTLAPAGLWLGAAEQAKNIKQTLTWTRWTMALYLRKFFQNKQVLPTLRFLRQQRTQHCSTEIRNFILSF